MLFIFIIVLIVILVPIVAIISESNENKKRDKEMKPYEKKNNALASEKCWHLSGLPLAEGKECVISLCEDKILIESNNTTYNLKIEKIEDMNIMTSKEVQNSISNAAAGSILLGPLGVVLMGSSTQINRIFTIIYKDKDDIDKCISFNLGDNIKNFQYTSNYINAFNEQINKSKEINL